jgi:hypothetical protein
MTEADIVLEELGKLRQATGAGDRNRLLRIRRRAVAGDGDKDEEVDVEASPGVWESIKNWWRQKGDEGEASKDVDEALARTFLNPKSLPEMNPYEAIQKKRRRLRDLDALLEE